VAHLDALRTEPTLRHTALVGVVLGLGWLTKVVFVPIAAGLLAFWAYRRWTRGGATAVLGLWPHVAVAGGLIAIIAGWWYADAWSRYGFAMWGNDLGRLEDKGGLAAGLEQHFTVGKLGRFVAAFVVRFAWSSTWSLARPDYLSLVPLAVLVLGALAAYLLALRGRGLTEAEGLAAWLAAPLVAAFGAHMLMWIALLGQGSGFGGYYLHVLVAPAGAGLGLATRVLWRRAGTRIAWISLSIYSIAFAAAVSWAQTLLFAGILARSDARFYELPGAMPAWLGIPDALGRLGAIAFPLTGAALWLAGGGLVLAGTLHAARALGVRPTATPWPSPPGDRDRRARDTAPSA
jgi:hypothetical protein